MSKYINYLILCCTLLLHCCEERNTIPEGNKPTNGSKNTKDNSASQNLGGTDQKTITLNLEQQKFNSLILGFKTIRASIEDDLKSSGPEIEPIYTEFIRWLSNNPQKQKELANAFTKIYDFFDEKRKIHANNRTFDEYITDAINAGYGNHENGKYGKDVVINADIPAITTTQHYNYIWDFFRNTIDAIRYQTTNEDKFQTIINEVSNDNHINNWL
ncbi:Mlp family lipoprotein (plasmid) [Borrelia miyamotoi]|uniref:Mlp family lipoprotein n=1 Tax=Borrelia miyamotoi TaxID=47466 RepID=A0A5P8AUQ9_9SPIR|nr:Mlp family lipoprotein [Borrelia miyamotoi]QFP42602.1 Mlp family lipoprotein [Borrelia miyamotoi]WAZ72901.1 Mlp family lipoprotein [Borrelia miyamotoi]